MVPCLATYCLDKLKGILMVDWFTLSKTYIFRYFIPAPLYFGEIFGQKGTIRTYKATAVWHNMGINTQIVGDPNIYPIHINRIHVIDTIPQHLIAIHTQ